MRANLSGRRKGKAALASPPAPGGQRAALKNPLGYGEPRPEGCGAGSGGAAAASSAEFGSPLASVWGWAGPGPSSPTAPSPKAAGCEARPGAGELGGMGASWRGDAGRRVPRASPPSPSQGAPSSNVGLGVKPPASSFQPPASPKSIFPSLQPPQSPAPILSSLSSPQPPSQICTACSRVPGTCPNQNPPAGRVLPKHQNRREPAEQIHPSSAHSIMQPLWVLYLALGALKLDLQGRETPVPAL